MRILYALLVLVIGFITGIIYHFSFSDNNQKSMANFKQSLKNENLYQMNQLNSALEGAYKKEIKNDIVSSYEKNFEASELEDKIDILSKSDTFSGLDKALPSDDEYKLFLKRMVIGDYFREIIFDNEKIDIMTETYLKKFKKNPQKSIAAIEAFLNMPDVETKFPSAVTGLLLVSSSLPQVDGRLKEIAYEISIKSVVTNSPSKKNIKNENDLDIYLSSTYEMFVPVIAHRVYLSKESNPQMAIERTIDSISAQTDERIQGEILRNFYGKYPKVSNQLKDQLKDRGINI